MLVLRLVLVLVLIETGGEQSTALPTTRQRWFVS